MSHLINKLERTEKGSGRWQIPSVEPDGEELELGCSSGGQCRNIPLLPNIAAWEFNILDGGDPFVLRASCSCPTSPPLALTWTHTLNKLLEKSFWTSL